MKTFEYSIGAGDNKIAFLFHAASRKAADVIAGQHADKKVHAFVARHNKSHLGKTC